MMRHARPPLDGCVKAALSLDLQRMTMLPSRPREKLGSSLPWVLVSEEGQGRRPRAWEP